MPSQSSDAPSYRQIRAKYDETSITVYQAYSEEIATAAVIHQKLNASPAFSSTRMTWIKPSWAWMLYRSGYSYKDDRQARILALKVTHQAFESLLRKAVLAHGPPNNRVPEKNKTEGPTIDAAPVRVQWDPERTVRLERLDYRSIQIGIPGSLVPELIDGVIAIEDVTGTARELKGVLDQECTGKAILEELIERGLVPLEKVYEVDQSLRNILLMEAS